MTAWTIWYDQKSGGTKHLPHQNVVRVRFEEIMARVDLYHTSAVSLTVRITFG
jgi:hypothetical protein